MRGIGSIEASTLSIEHVEAINAIGRVVLGGNVATALELSSRTSDPSDEDVYGDTTAINNDTQTEIRASDDPAPTPPHRPDPAPQPPQPPKDPSEPGRPPQSTFRALH